MMIQENLNQKTKNSILAYVLILPVAAYLLLLMLAPFIWAVWLSMTDKSIGDIPRFIGFTKYLEALVDPLFYKSVLNTVIFTIGAVGGKVVFGVIIALVLNESFKGRNLCRALLILPWTIPTVLSILTWKWLFSDIGGVLNYLAMFARITNSNILWLASPNMAMFSIIIVNIWRGAPFIGISVLAGLQTIPKDLYEAARIDGANVFNQFRHITIPHILNVLMLATLVTTIWTMNDFQIAWLLTQGGPVNATEIISVYSYRVGFMNMDLSKAIAVSILLMPLMMLLVSKVTKQTLTDRT
jgi:multiple sugar transport system permease protein